MKNKSPFVLCIGALTLAVPAAAQQPFPVWKDPGTGSLWTAQDNGSNVDQKGANEYCERLQVGGYSDWSLPSNEDFATMYVTEIGRGHPLLERHEGTYWSSTMEKSSQAWVVRFDKSRRSPMPANLKEFRAICVRRGDQSRQGEGASATLIIATDSAARIVVDGRLAGHLVAGGSMNVAVAPGSHQITAINTQEGAQVTQTIDLAAGYKTTIRLPLADAVSKVRRSREERAAQEAKRTEEIRVAVAALRTRFQETPRRTVIDLKSRREWAGEGSASALNWIDATRYCGDLSLGERSDWRLPSTAELEEMRSAVRAQPKYCCAAAPGIRLGSNSGLLWSNATGNGTQAWALDLWNVSKPRQLEPIARSDGPSALCVRSE
jgi:uncharacterized protein DUF1566